MKTIKKDFDCLEMKSRIQAKIYKEIKDMNTTERIAYFYVPPAQDPFRKYAENPRETADFETSEAIKVL